MIDKIALVIHVLGWVFWLGTDLGVLLTCRYAEKHSLSVETRMTLLEVGMILDRLPRFAVPLVWGSGVILSEHMGYTFLPTYLGLFITVFWLVATYLITFTHKNSHQYNFGLLSQTFIYGSVILGMGFGGSLLLYSGDIPLWLALKWYGYVIVAISALALEKYFIPVIVGFNNLVTEGPTELINAKLSADLRPVYAMVLCIYSGTLLAGLAGLLKPTL